MSRVKCNFKKCISIITAALMLLSAMPPHLAFASETPSSEAQIINIDNTYEYVQMNLPVGFIQGNTNPAIGSLYDWTADYGVALDKQGTGIGVDYGETTKLDKIELLDRADDISNYNKPTDPTYNYLVYISDDNSTFTQATDFQVTSSTSNGKLVHTFTFGNVNARYVKITTTSTYTNTNYLSFVLQKSSAGVRAYKKVKSELSTDINKEYTQINVQIGYIRDSNSQPNPEIGSLYDWTYDYLVALDYKGTSIGVNYGETRKLGKIELWDNDDTSNYKNTSASGLTYDYLVYVSQDNKTFTKTTDWQVTSSINNGRLIHTFTFGNVMAQYVKITTTSNYKTGWSFAAYKSDRSVKVYEKVRYEGISVSKGVLVNDSIPQNGSLEKFGVNINVNLDSKSTSVGMDFGKITNVSHFEIQDSDQVNRLNKESYKIYVSNDNKQYIEVKGWGFNTIERDGKAVNQFNLGNTLARYVKITTTSQDENSTFNIADLQNDIKVYAKTTFIKDDVKKAVIVNDTNKNTGAFTQWTVQDSVYDSVYLDYKNTSIGIDYGTKKEAGKVEVYSSVYSTRLDSTNYKIYISDDNITYQQTASWELEKGDFDGKIVHSLYFKDIICRYIKITTDFDDEIQTFKINNLGKDIRASVRVNNVNKESRFDYFEMPAAKGLSQNDSTPETGVINHFGDSVGATVDTYGNSIGLDLGSVKEIGKFELIDSDKQSTLSKEKYKLFVSNDNVNYKEIKDWSFETSIINDKDVHSFTFDNMAGRYFKFTTLSNDRTFNLIDIQKDVKAYGKYKNTFGTTGFIANDYNPESGMITTWNPSGAVALDYSKRSIAIDLGEKKTVGKIELINWKNILYTRLIDSDYSVYVSDDNWAYTKVEGWEFRSSVEDGQLIHSLILPTVSTRYVKITTRYTDKGFTFAPGNSLSEGMLAYTIDSSYEPVSEGTKKSIGYISSDSSPWNTPIGNWTVPSSVYSLYLDTYSNSIGADLGNVIKICKIELSDSDMNDSIPISKYKIYTSEDNKNFKQLINWDFQKNISNEKSVITFEFDPDTRARYIKVNAGFNNEPPTFNVSDINKDLKIYLSPSTTLPVSMELPTQTDSESLNANKSIMVNFRKISNVSKIEILNESISSLINGQSFKLYKSNDGNRYTPIDQWNFLKVSSEGKIKSVFELQETQAKYIKIDIVDGNEAAFVINNIKEDVKGFANIYSETIPASITYDNGLAIDFGNTSNINTLEVWGYDTTSNANTSNLKMFSSTNGIDYNEVVGSKCVLSTVNGTPVTSYSFNGLEARYIKLDINQTGKEKIKAYSTPIIIPINMRTDMIKSDVDPVNTSAVKFGTEAMNVPLDYNNTSICIDMDSIQDVNRVEIHGKDAQASINKGDFDLYYSDDNTTYNKISDWAYTTAIVNKKLVYIFEFAGINAQFLKINYKLADGASQFIIGDIQKDVNTYSMRDINQAQESKVQSVLGYCELDYCPENGKADFWGYNGSFEFDLNMRSIVADLGSEKAFNVIKLYDSDNGNALRKDLFSLYVSDDNIAYQKIENWDMFKKDNVITFYNLSSIGRYVKVHQHLNIYSIGMEPTFTSVSNSFQTTMEVYNEAPEIWTLSGNGKWQHSRMLKIENTVAQDVYNRDVYDGVVYISKEDARIPILLSQGFVNNDLSDIRFADSSNRELSFYEEDQGFYVRIPFIAKGESTKIYMYYGNPSATKRSDGETTFYVEYGTKTFDVPQVGGNAKYIKLNNGNLMIIYGAESSTPDDSGEYGSDVYCKVSEDNGKTWSEQRFIIDLGKGDNPGSAQVLPNGDIILVFFDVVKYTTSNSLTESKCTQYYTRSSDNGENWSDAVKIDTGWNYSLTNTSPIRIEIEGGKNRIILPFSYVYTNTGSFRSSVMYSDDDGATWTKSVSNFEIKDNVQGYEGGITECAIIQLSNGDLKVFYRAQVEGVTHLGESVSTDNGITWSEWKNSIVYSPNTLPIMTRDDENILLMWSGNNSFGGTSRIRTPLNMAYSKDDTESWQGYKDILAGTYLWTSEWSSDGKASSGLITQPDMVIAKDGSMNILWTHGFKFVPTVRIENMRDWLYKSHGGYNDFETENIQNDYWWKLSVGIGTSKEQRYRGLASLRLKDNQTASVTQAARSFTTGINDGIVKFKLYADNLDSEFSFSLRECYSFTEDAPGNMFQFSIKSDGTLTYKKNVDEYKPLPVNTILDKNTWYDIEIRFDTEKKLCKILVNGEDKGNIEVYMDENIINYFYMSSGLNDKAGTTVYIDELIIMDNSVPALKLNTDRNDSEIDIKGPSTITIPQDGCTESSYTAVLTDDQGNVMQDEPFQWNINPEVTGVTVDETGTVTVSSITDNTSFTLIAKSVTDPEKMASMLIKLKKDVNHGDDTSVPLSNNPPVGLDGNRIETTETGELRIVSKPKYDEVNKTASAVVTLDNINTVLNKARQDIDGVRKVELEVQKVEGAQKYVQELPVKTLSESGKGIKLEIKTPLGTVDLPGNILNGIDVKGNDTVKMSVAIADLSNISEADRMKIGNRPVIDITLQYGNENILWNNPDTAITISIDYKPSQDELKDKEHILIWYIDNKGKREAVLNSKYNVETGKVTFTVTHFSKYAIAFVKKTFNDADEFQWAKKQIEVLASKGVINGTSETTFDPGKNITRADFTTLIIRTLGLDAEFDKSFDDVNESDYYYESVGIAKKLGIVNGAGDYKFKPQDEITREDMMVIIARALKISGKSLPTASAEDINTFEDASSISEYALDDIAALVKNGLVQGYGKTVQPKGNATRAETAVLMYRILNK